MQRKITISAQDLAEIKKRKQTEQNAKIYKRLLAIELRGHNTRCADIALIVGVCIDTISDWTNLYVSGGIDALCSLEYAGRRTSILEQYTKSMKEKVEQESIKTIVQMKTWLKEEHLIEVEESWLFRFCKKNSVFPTKKPV